MGGMKGKTQRINKKKVKKKRRKRRKRRRMVLVDVIGIRK